MNILLTSVGRRAYMVKYFQEALHGTGEVHVCNSDELTVAFRYADHSVVSPLIYDAQYIPFLLDYCQSRRIDLLISLFDIDLPVLARHREDFEKVGTRVIVSQAELVEICNDKWKTYCFLKENGFHAPQTYLSLSQALCALEAGELQYPVIVKPRFGCGSIALAAAEDEEELRYQHRKIRQMISRTYLKYESSGCEETILFQQCLQGQEYGADVINDLDGTYCTSIVKKKLAMRAGETDIAEIICEPDIEQETARLGRITGHIANLDCDLFMVDGVPYILEMNARFGGGYPFSHLAGCNLPLAIVKWARGERVEPELLRAKRYTRGFKELVLTDAERI